MKVEIRREDYRSLAAYASIPSSFQVAEVVDLPLARSGDATLPTRAIATAWDKNYDAVPGNDPLSWSKRFDVRSWICLAAYAGGELIGGGIVVAAASAIAQLDGRSGTAILWDLRVAPAWRRRGAGRALLSAAEDAARSADCRALDVETQDINVTACRLYSECGYTLLAIIPDAYPDAPHEAKLLWSKQLAGVG